MVVDVSSINWPDTSPRLGSDVAWCIGGTPFRAASAADAATSLKAESSMSMGGGRSSDGSIGELLDNGELL